MSIATEITALGTNLAAAKNAVTTKGGTIGDTGLAGLATEIESIPSGGLPSGNWGTIKYTIEGVDKTYNLQNETDYLKLISASNDRFYLNNDLITTASIKELELAEGIQFIPSNFCQTANNLEKLTLPSTIKYIGDYCFMYNSITHPVNLENVAYIGANFLAYSSTFNQPINLPNIVIIGGGFLYNDTSFNSSVTIGNKLISLGASFLRSCTAFAQPSVTIPSSIEYRYPTSAALGMYFMSNCNNFSGTLICNAPTAASGLTLASDVNTLSTTSSTAAMYTTGITLTGTSAQAWKDAFPDRSTSPYRQLILGS